MTTDEQLFDAGALRVVPPEPERMTAGERLRRRQAVRIGQGLHPLSIGGAIIRLHPDAPRVLEDDRERGKLRCGSCVFRRFSGGHARDYPKCSFGGGEWSSTWPRASMSDATDVRAWWPACVDYQAEEADR